MNNPINIGILGCSAIADKTVLPTIKCNPNFNLVMVGSRSEEKGRVFGEKYGCKFGDYEAVLNNKSIDAIYVSTPTGLHFEWGMEVLGSGKHLLLEKPFTATIEQAIEIVETAKNKNLIAMEGLAYVYHPYFIELKNLIDKNVIGEIRLVESSFGFPKLPITDIRNKHEIGGGAILDNLIYPLSLGLSLFGDNYQSHSYQIHYNKDLKIDERGFLRLDWENLSANLTYGFGFTYKNCIDFWGSNGTISIDRAFTKPANQDAEIIIKTNDGINRVVVNAANQFDLMLDGFYQKISGQDLSNKNEKNDILSRMELISEMYKSIL
jgi:NDP-hexose-3-ketoreductase